MVNEEDPAYYDVDWDKFFRLVDEQIEAGVDGLLIAGTTGQSATLTESEHYILVSKAIQHTNGRVPVMVGAGSNATYQAKELSEELASCDTKIKETKGMPILLHNYGYYNVPPKEGVYKHFAYLAEQMPDCPIVMYNIPGRTCCDISTDVVTELAERYPNIIGIKYAKPKSLEVVKEIVENTDPEKFRVMSGNDDEFYDFLDLGAHGIISAAASIIPYGFMGIYNLYNLGEKEKARYKQKNIEDLLKAVYAPNTKNPMALNSMFDSALRLPLFNIWKGFDIKNEHGRKAYEDYAPVRVMIREAMKNHEYELIPLAKETYKNL